MLARFAVLLPLGLLAGCGGRSLTTSDAVPRDAGARPDLPPPDGGALGDGAAAPSEAIGWSLAVDDAWVYWTTPSGAVVRQARSGGPPVVVVASQGEQATLAIDASAVYYTVCSSSGSCSIRRVAKGGGPSLTLAADQPMAGALVVDDAHLFWATGAGRIVRLPKAGGLPGSLCEATEPGGSLRLPHVVVGDGERLYWSAGGAIWSVRKDGAGGAQVLASAAEGRNPVGLTVAAGVVTWAAAGEPALHPDGSYGFPDGELRAVSTGGGPVASLAQRLSWPSGVVVGDGGSTIYFTSVTTGLLRLPALVDATGVHSLLEGGGASHVLVRDATHLFWSSGGGLRTRPLDGD